MTYPIVYGKELKNYFMDHVKKYDGEANFYKVQKPLHAFKKTLHNGTNSFQHCVIVNLIIPKDAIVYADSEVFSRRLYFNDRKMRASEAFVHSQHLLNSKTVNTSYAFHENFKYSTGETVHPTRNAFSWDNVACEAGIHFFLNVGDALDY